MKKNNTLLIASRSVICCQCVQVSESVLTFDRSNPFQCFYFLFFFLMKLRSLITRKMLPCVNHLLTWNGRPVPPCTSNHFIFVESTLHKLLCPHSCPSVPQSPWWVIGEVIPRCFNLPKREESSMYISFLCLHCKNKNKSILKKVF